MKFGVTELLIILAVVVIVLGPTQIPKLTKMFGKSVKSFKDGLGAEEPEEAAGETASGKKTPPAKAADEDRADASGKEGS